MVRCSVDAGQLEPEAIVTSPVKFWTVPADRLSRTRPRLNPCRGEFTEYAVPRPSYLAWVDRGLGARARNRRQSIPSGPGSATSCCAGRSSTGFEIVDAITDQHIAGPMQLSRAIQAAKAYGAITLWQQTSMTGAGPSVNPFAST